MNNCRKLLHHAKVEVRQLEEGLKGSWHSGLVVGVSDSCRKVRYDELLSESGTYKLVESIPVTGAIEGLYQRPCVKSNYRGRIRPVPPRTEPCSLDTELKFGTCVDVLYKEAWWEGVIFDCDEGAKERRVFSPDEGDVRVYKLSDIRVTFEWDEFSDNWKERGIWLLVNLAREHKKDGSLCQLIRRVWSRLNVHYGYQKMITEWTCGSYHLWKEYFREVISEITAESRAKSVVFPSTNRHAAQNKGRRFKRGSYLNNSVLTRSMQRRKDKEVSLAVRTRHMCMSEPENSPISAATKVSHLDEFRLRQKHSMPTDTCGLIESPEDSVRGDSDQAPSVCRVPISDCVMEKVEFHYGRTSQNRDLPARSPSCYENNPNVPVRTRFRRKWLFLERSLIPRKPRSLISSRKFGKHVGHGSKITRHAGSHVSFKVLDYPSVERRKRLSQTRQKVGFTTRYSVRRQCVRRGLPVRSIRKKRSPLRINKKYSRKSEFKNLTSSKELEASKSSRKDVLGSHSESTLSVADSCEDLGSDDTLNNPGKQKAKKSRCHDSVCFICQYGDELLQCDNCMSSYHLLCGGPEEATTGGLFCPSCRCGLCGLRGCGSDNQRFSDVCYQCSRQYHLACLDQAGIAVSEDRRFCSKSCFEICVRLHQLLRISNSTSEEDLTWTITRSRRNDCNVYNERAHPLIQVSQVSNVFHECFQPITEPHTGRDLVTEIVYNSGSKFRRLDFHGFYVMALLDGDDIVCAATVRIHGRKVAEMPLIATPFKYRRQGMCRLLLLELEKMLVELGVERLVLPGIAALSETWVTSFGFTEMPASVRKELLGYPFVVFQGTTMFEKVLSRSFEVAGSAKACTRGSVKANECAKTSSNKCGVQQNDTTKRVLRPITRTFKLGIDCEGSLQESTKLNSARRKCLQENRSKNERRRFNPSYKRKKLEAFNKEKTALDSSDKTRPTFKCVHKRRRIQASRDSPDA